MNYKRWTLDHQSCLRNVQSCSRGKKTVSFKTREESCKFYNKNMPNTSLCNYYVYYCSFIYLSFITDCGCRTKKIIIQTHFAFDERSFLFVITFYSVDFSSYCAEEISCLTGFLPLNNFSVTRAIDSRVGKQLLRSITLTPFWI